MMSDDDVGKDGEVSEEDLLEVNEGEEGDEDEKDGDESAFDEFGNPIEE